MMKLAMTLTSMALAFTLSASSFASSNDGAELNYYNHNALEKINQATNELKDHNDLKSVGYHYRHSHAVDYDHKKFRGSGGKRFPKQIRATGERVFVFSPRLKAWAAYAPDGQRVGYGRANGGSHWCEDLGRPCRTPRGSFRIRSKGSPECRSSKFPLPNGGAPMPYCMHFHGGYAVHGSPYISNQNTSHGCIRVQTEAARWLSNYFMKIGTRVLVISY